jgi:hypothetical protein
VQGCMSRAAERCWRVDGFCESRGNLQKTKARARPPRKPNPLMQRPVFRCLPQGNSSERSDQDSFLDCRSSTNVNVVLVRMVYYAGPHIWDVYTQVCATKFERIFTMKPFAIMLYHKRLRFGENICFEKGGAYLQFVELWPYRL